MNTPDDSLFLQARWRVVEHENRPHLLYYGVRNPPLHREQLLSISDELATQLLANGQTPPSAETAALQQKGILVKRERVQAAKTSATMQVCTRCVNNDYVIPGLEFDDQGVCALCQCYELDQAPANTLFTTVSEQDLRSSRTQSTSRFDAMVLYTGGKDSSYMLWLLARKLKLRVLAAFWNMPYCTPAAYANMARARERMDDVEFVEWTLPLGKVRQAMQAKWRTHGWPCLCPTAAFPMLYPLAAQWRIPYVFLGLEDVQASVMDYVFPPAGGAKPATQREQTLAFLQARALPHSQRMPVKWTDEMANYHAAVHASMPEVFDELADLVQRARNDANVFVPLIARLATNEAYGTWADAKQIIETEMGWQAPAGQSSLLHTSCLLEPVKDYLQFQRFKAMRTVFMPQSLVETAAAVFFGLTSRDEALAAVQELGYWEPPPILDTLAADLGIAPDDVLAAEDELAHSMAEWASTQQRS